MINNDNITKNNDKETILITIWTIKIITQKVITVNSIQINKYYNHRQIYLLDLAKQATRFK